MLDDLLGRVAGCFPRRETRQSCGQMVSGLLMELEDHNCWTIAEAAGHCGPHRLQHLLSRAVWDERQVLDAASAWAVGRLGEGAVVTRSAVGGGFRPAFICGRTARRRCCWIAAPPR